MADFSADEAPLPSLEEILAERVDDLEVSIGELSIDSECVYVLFSSALVTLNFRCVVNAGFSAIHLKTMKPEQVPLNVLPVLS